MLVDRLPVRKILSCGRCWYGECMCAGVKDTTHKIIPPRESQRELNYKGMAFADPRAQRMIEASTATFLAELQEEIQAGIKRRSRSNDC